MERAIAEREPERITNAEVTGRGRQRRGMSEQKLRQTLRGDVATIVAKCLRPRPKDRYASLDGLAGDIQRYLNGWPVLARPQTTMYLIGKYVRRKRRKLVFAALAFLVVLVSSLAYAGWRQEQAVLEGQRAVRMQTFLYRLLYLANSNYTGKPSFTVPDFLELGVKLLPDYIKDPADLRKAQMSLAESMYENNDLDGAARVFGEVIASANRSRLRYGGRVGSDGGRRCLSTGQAGQRACATRMPWSYRAKRVSRHRCVSGAPSIMRATGRGWAFAAMRICN